MAAILAVLSERIDRRLRVIDIVSLTGAPQSTVTRILNRLEAAGIVTSVRHGRNRIVTMDWSRPWARPLAELLAVTAGVPGRISEAIRSVPGVVQAHLFGSWVSRNIGEAGPPPGDIDLLVIGDVDYSLLRAALGPVEKRVGLGINPVIVTAEEWANRDHDPFLKTVAERPMLELHRDDEEHHHPGVDRSDVTDVG